MNDTITLSNGQRVEPGCWLDGHMGWHNNLRAVRLAEHHGFTVPPEYAATIRAYASADTQPEDHDEAMTGQGELLDQATEYLESLLPDADANGDHWSFVWDMGELCLLRVDADGESVY